LIVNCQLLFIFNIANQYGICIIQCVDLYFFDLLRNWRLFTLKLHVLETLNGQNSVCSRFEFWVFKSGVLKNYSFSVSMVRRRISEAQRWQIIGMHTKLLNVRWATTILHGSRVWLVDIRHNGHTCVSTSF
jgi:hypothetical protein